jgi:hypothetical protein
LGAFTGGYDPQVRSKLVNDITNQQNDVPKEIDNGVLPDTSTDKYYNPVKPIEV